MLLSLAAPSNNLFAPAMSRRRAVAKSAVHYGNPHSRPLRLQSQGLFRSLQTHQKN